MTDQQPAPITDAELDEIESLANGTNAASNRFFLSQAIGWLHRLISALRAERARADKAQALICAIKDAHVTDEEGDNLVDVCRNAHQSEFEHAHLPAPCQIDGCQYKKLEAQLAEARTKLDAAYAALADAHENGELRFSHPVFGVSSRHWQIVDKATSYVEAARAAQKESDNG